MPPLRGWGFFWRGFYKDLAPDGAWGGVCVGWRIHTFWHARERRYFPRKPGAFFFSGHPFSNYIGPA